MKNYLDNPFNPVMFASYKQVPELAKMNPENEAVKRTIHMDVVYSKLKTRMPNLLSIGPRGIQKSTLLNGVINSNFEVIHDGTKQEQAGLFHDSVDAIFHSEDFPIGFNVYDF